MDTELPALITVRGRSLPIFVLCRPYMVRLEADEVNVFFFFLSLNQVLILIVKPKNMLFVSSALALQKSPQDFGSQPPASLPTLLAVFIFSRFFMRIRMEMEDGHSIPYGVSCY